MEYLDFELPIKELHDQLKKCDSIGVENDIDVSETFTQIEEKLYKTKKEIYGNLSAWQRVQLSRHPSRPYTLDYINALTEGSFLELHGDRNVLSGCSISQTSKGTATLNGVPSPGFPASG